MSQKKVDYYKEQKANRKSIMRKEKMRFRLEMAAIVVVLVGLIGWFSYSVYDNAKATADASTPANSVPIYITAMTEYLEDLDNGAYDSYVDSDESEDTEDTEAAEDSTEVETDGEQEMDQLEEDIVEEEASTDTAQ